MSRLETFIIILVLSFIAKFLALVTQNLGSMDVYENVNDVQIFFGSNILAWLRVVYYLFIHMTH